MTPLYCVLRTDWLAPPMSQWENLLRRLRHLKLARVLYNSRNSRCVGASR